MVGHAALAACLCCIGAGTDIPIGTPFAGRMEDFQGVVGLFINSLVLRIDLSDDPTFEEVIRRAREADFDALAHADVPFDFVVEA